MIQEQALKESTLEDRELILTPRCGNCRRFPGNGQICEERGRPVHRRNNAKKYCYDPMTPSELKAYKEELREQQKAYYLALKEQQKAYYLAHKEQKKAYYLAHKEELKEQQKAEKRRLKTALNALEKLKVVDPELYEKLIAEEKTP